MTDVHEPWVRSYNMSQIRSKNTLPEITVRRFLHAKGFRYKLYDRNLPGRPDIVLPRYKTVIYVHGCFWHGHEGCKYFVMPKTREFYWQNKIEVNKDRDNRNKRELENLGWQVLIVWECKLKSGTAVLESLVNLIKS